MLKTEPLIPQVLIRKSLQKTAPGAYKLESTFFGEPPFRVLWVLKGVRLYCTHTTMKNNKIYADSYKKYTLKGGSLKIELSKRYAPA